MVLGGNTQAEPCSLPYLGGQNRESREMKAEKIHGTVEKDVQREHS